MKVLHVSASDGGGGAARAATRVHKAISTACPERWASEMLVARKYTESDDVYQIEQSQLLRTGTSVVRRALDQEVLLSRTGNQSFRSPARLPTIAPSRVSKIRPDVTLLHWLGSRMLSVRQIGRLAAQEVPLAWVLHDMWTFCGTEHYAQGAIDRRFIEGYLSGNRLPGEWGVDVDRRAWERKRKYWRQPIHLVAPSRWIAGQASASALASEWPTTVIPNPLDVDWWGNISRREARRSLGLHPDSPILMFGAIGGDKDSRKGAGLLYEALGNISNHHGLAPLRPLTVITFGGKPGARRVGQHVVHSVGRLDDEGLRGYYTAADVMVVPSRMDNLPQTAVEAIVCGTPVVAFRTGGLPDIVDDGTNGRLAEPFSPESLAKAIGWVLESRDRHRQLSESARLTASRWNPEQIAKRYVALFEEMLER